MDQNQMMLDYLMEMGAMQPEQEKIARQRATVDLLRQNGQMPGMRGGGRLQSAANPLEFLNSALSTGLGAYGEQQANRAQDAYGQKRRDVLASLRQRMQSSAPGATPGIVPPAGGGSPYGDDPYGVRGW